MKRRNIIPAAQDFVKGRVNLTIAYWHGPKGIEFLFGQDEAPILANAEEDIKTGMLYPCEVRSLDMTFSIIENILVKNLEIAHNLTHIELLGDNDAITYYRVTFNASEQLLAKPKKVA